MAKQIKIEEAQEGMIVAEGVEDKVGRPILKAGDTIKASFIPRLKRWGIDQITVESDDDQEDGEGDQEEELSDQEITSLVDEKYRFFDINSHMQIVKKVARRYFVRAKNF